MKHLDDSTADPATAIGFLLKALQHSLRQAMDEALRRQGIDLSFAHFATLFGVCCEPGINGAVLARRAMVSAQTMNAMLRRLERDGQIERRRNPDNRRADNWYITAAGNERLEQARVVGDAVFARMLSALGAEDSRRLLGYLRRCVQALEQGAAD
ncbi:MAG: MarR family transcriptional regulator [Gammaproteobacteria bacterium]|nr:MarR family transcriptional regulator [Gammaproteobacteria bacterium]